MAYALLAISIGLQLFIKVPAVLENKELLGLEHNATISYLMTFFDALISGIICYFSGVGLSLLYKKFRERKGVSSVDT